MKSFLRDLIHSMDSFMEVTRSSLDAIELESKCFIHLFSCKSSHIDDPVSELMARYGLSSSHADDLVWKKFFPYNAFLYSIYGPNPNMKTLGPLVKTYLELFLLMEHTNDPQDCLVVGIKKIKQVFPHITNFLELYSYMQ